MPTLRSPATAENPPVGGQAVAGARCLTHKELAWSTLTTVPARPPDRKGSHPARLPSPIQVLRPIDCNPQSPLVPPPSLQVYCVISARRPHPHEGVPPGKAVFQISSFTSIPQFYDNITRTRQTPLHLQRIPGRDDPGGAAAYPAAAGPLRRGTKTHRTGDRRARKTHGIMITCR